MASRDELARALMGMTPGFPVVAPGIGSPLAVPDDPRPYSYSGQPLSAAVGGMFGLDPGMERGAILPVGRQPGGDTEFAAPQWLYEIAKAFVAPSHAYRGGTVTDEDALNFGLTVAGGGGAVGTAAAPRGALATGGVRSARSLPMDEASRMARAREMGFDTDTPLYHGTDADIPAFRTLFEIPLHTGGARGRGTYLTDSPRTASAYSVNSSDTFQGKAGRFEGANVMPVMARGRILDEERRLTKAEIDELERVAIQEGYGNLEPGDLAMAFDGSYPPIARNVLQEISYQPGVVNHVLQMAGYAGRKGPAVAVGGTDVLMFRPENIRSRFAKFDPAKSESADLLAANASPYLSLIYALMGESDAGTVP